MTVFPFLKSNKRAFKVLFLLFFGINYSIVVAQTNPGGVSGATLWYRSDLGITNNPGVQQWDNQASASYNLLVAAAKPAYNSTSNLINFNPTLGFNGISSFMQVASMPRDVVISNAHQTSHYVVYKKTTANNPYIYNHSNNIGGSFSIGSGSDRMLAGGRNTTFTAPTTGEIRLQSLQGDASTGGAVETRINGASVSTTWTGTGASDVGTQPFNVGVGQAFEVAEIIVFPNNTNAANERQKVESYLGLKYGITLPYNYMDSDASVYWNTITNTGYNDNITGLGRDEASKLYQKQSKSINTGDQIVIGVGGALAESNPLNSNSLTDKQFLVVGDNGLAKSLSTSLTGITGINSRFAAIWKVQNTNAVTTVRVMWPQGIANIKLIQSTDAVFNGTDTVTDMAANTQTIGGIVYNYADVTLTNGQFFTFAGSTPAPGGVSDASLWYRADLGITNNSGVQQWDNQASASYNLVQATATARPAINTTTNLINFNPTVGFDGTNDLLQAASVPQAITVNASNQSSQYIVYKKIGAATSILYHHSNNAEGTYNVGARDIWMMTSNRTSTLSGPANGEIRMQSIQGDTGSVLTRVNGTTASSTWNGTIANSGTQPFNVGASASTFNSSQIAEIIIFPNNTNAANERQKVESYLASKYGITLPFNYMASDGSVFWNTATNASYGNNITVIGRDDTSKLTQKQSQSINSGNQIIVSNGALATANGTNSSTFSADKQFLAIGDNNTQGVIAFNDAFGDPSIYSRLNRVWFADNSGSYASDTRILIPSTLNNTTGMPKLVVSTTSNFASTATSTTNFYIAPESALVTVNGITYLEYKLTGAQVATDFYFTLTNNVAPGGIGTGLTSWFKANSGVVLTSGKVSSWVNQATNTNLLNLAQTDVAKRPIVTENQYNFNPVLTFSGAQVLESTITGSLLNVFGANSNEFFGVLNINSTGTNVYFQGSDNGATSNRLSFENSFVHFPTSTSQISGNQLSITSNLPSLFRYTSSGATQTYSLFGKQTASAAVTGSMTAGTAPRITLGGHKDASGTYSYYINGNYAENITYNQNKTATERRQIESYLALKYGNTLDQTTPTDYLASDGNVVWNATTNATYKNNIAGIGRDDFSGLNQKQSKSSNTGNQVIMSLGTIAATNELNATSITANKQFLTWGDNNLNTIETFSTPLDATVFSRSGKIWKAQNSGSFSQEIQLLIPINFYQGSQTPKLVYATAADLSVGTSIKSPNATTTTVNGVAHYVFNLTATEVNTDFYFSLLNTIAPGGVNPNMVLWLKGDNGLTPTNGSVTSWVDQTNNNTFTQTGTPTAIDKAINFNPAVQFNGTSFFTGNKALTSTEAFAVAKIANATGTNASGGVLGNSTLLGGNYFFHTEGGTFFVGNSVTYTGTNAFGNNVGYALMNADLSETPAASNKIKINGLAYANTPAGDPTPYIDIPVVGARKTEPLLNGSAIAEVILYDASKTTDRQKIISYLALKYGLTLDQSIAQNYVNSSNTVVWNGTANALYKNNIAGIGRDDMSGLYQKQSYSFNTGNQVVFSRGSAANSNAANANTFDSNNQFLTWGDTNLTGTVPLTEGVSYVRTNRVWAVDNTGAYNQDTDLLIPTALKNGNVTLVLNSNASFTSGTNTLIPLTNTITINNVKYYKVSLTASQIANDFYFALAENDNDADGVGDADDIDDDNDGVLDALESASCFYQTTDFTAGNRASTGIEMSSEITFVAPFNQLPTLVDGDVAASGIAYTNAASAVNKTVLKVEFPTAIEITDLYLRYQNANSIFNNTTVVLQGSNDDLNWTNLNTASAISNTATFGIVTPLWLTSNNYNRFTVTTNANKYKYYRIYGTVGNMFSNTGALGGIIREIYFSIPATYSPSLYPKPTCSADLDSDGKYNHQDVEADGDNCFDAFEAGVPSSKFNASTGIVTGTVGANGLANNLETVTDNGTINYGSYYEIYGLNATSTACLDSDADGVADISDLDDDNDGIVDTEESGSCPSTPSCTGQPQVVGAITTPACVGWSRFQNNIDFDFMGYFNGNPYFDMQGSFASFIFGQIQKDYATQAGANYSFTSYYISGNFAADAGGNLPVIEAVDVASGAVLATINMNATDNTTLNFVAISNQTKIKVGYAIPNNTAGGAGNKFWYEKGIVSTCDLDTDGDGIPNRLDLDSDGDGCPDAIEGGKVIATTSLVNSLMPGGNSGTGYTGTATLPITQNLGTTVGNTTTSLGVPTLIGNGQTANFALNSSVNGCTDTDTDGITNIDDIDDDNDGVLDAAESPTCFSTATEAAVISSISTQMATPANGNLITNIIDGNAATLYSFNTGDNWVGKSLYVITPALGAVSISGIQLDMGSSWMSYDATSTFKLQGSNDTGASWTDLSLPITSSVSGATITIANTLNLTSTFSRFRLVGVAGLSSYAQVQEIRLVITNFQPSLYPKATCTTDTDSDTILNHQDLDSDNDGCFDAVESGVPSTKFDATTGMVTGTLGANGFANDLETATDGGTINYTSTYLYYANNNLINACLDTDIDGIVDLVDIDDDNDGILDTVEKNCSSAAIVNKTGLIITKPATINYTFNGNTIANLIDNVDNNVYVTATPTGTLNGPWFNFEFPTPKALTYLEIGHYQGQYLFATSSTYKIQGSSDNTNWTDVTGTLTYNNVATSISGGLSNHNSNIADFPTNTTAYKYYRILGISASAGAGWATEIYFKEWICTDLNTDGDSTPNHLDLDSDNDGCFDAKEAGIPSTKFDATTGKVTGVVGTNGLANDLETVADNGIVNYTSTYNTYAKTNTLNLCTDTDTDGIPDVIDVDDDNDGVLDTTEDNCNPVLPATNTTNAAAFTVPTGWSIVTSSPDVADVNGHPYGTWNYGCVGTVPAAPNGDTKFASVTSPTLEAMGTTISGLEIGKPYTFTYYYGRFGAFGYTPGQVTVKLGAAIVDQYTPTLTTCGWDTRTITITPTAATQMIVFQATGAGNSMANIAVPTNAIQSTCDADGDTIPNSLDLDSDNDGCFDAVEAGVPSTKFDATTGKVTGVVGTNGLANDLETVADNGIINYTSTYNTYAKTNSLNLCIDTDIDGIPDVIDIDDDNDGVLDTVEMNCEVMKNGTFTQANTTNGAAIINWNITGNVRIGTNTLNFNSGNTTPNAVVYQDIATKIGFPLTIKYSVFTNNVSMGLRIDLIDVSTNTVLATKTTNSAVNVNESINFVPTGTSTRIRITDVSTLTANIDITLDNMSILYCDTDNDGTPNSLDLDSDNDGCFDAKESGVPSTKFDASTGKVTGAVGANGLADNLETVANNGIINYTSTYDTYAKSNTLELCIDTDLDGIPDVIDIDDDNDGVLDTVEGICSSTGSQFVPNVILRDGTLSNGVVVEGTWNDGQNVTVPNLTASYTGASGEIVSTSGIFTVGNNVIHNNSAPNVALVSGGSEYSVTDVWIQMQEFNAASTGGSVTYTNLFDQNGNQLLTLSDIEVFNIGYGYTPFVEDQTVVSITNPTPGTFVITKTGSQDLVWFKVRARNNRFISTFRASFANLAASESVSSTLYRIITYCPDTDNDGTPNSLDLDSDNDGCFDAREAGVPSTKFDASTGKVTGAVGANGLADNLETVANNGIINYTSTYANAINALFDNCYCTQSPNTALATVFSMAGISTQAKRAGWPEDVANGFLVLESKEKGFVITRLTTSQRDGLTAVEGMLIYNITNTRMELYNGTAWIPLTRSCNE